MKKVKVFDTEVSNCSDCQYAFPKAEKNKSEYLYCGKVKEYISDNGCNGVLKDCPFLPENSFTKEQFESIGFKKESDREYIKVLINGVITIKLTKLGFTYYEIYSYMVGSKEYKETKEQDYKAPNFPHLKLILESLI